MDNKIIVGGLIAVFIIVGGGYFFIFSNHMAPKVNTTLTSTAHVTTVQQTTLSSVTTIPHFNSTTCISANQITAIYDGNFSSGNYLGWIPTGVGFGTSPANITFDDEYNEYYGHPWTGWNGIFFATSYSGGLSVSQGNLTSKPFLVTEPYLNFKVISPSSAQLYIEILHNNNREVTIHYNTFQASNNTNATSNFVNASIILVPLLCKQVQIRIVAQVVGTGQNEFNYIAATGFYMSKRAFSSPGIIVNQSLNFS